EGRHTMSVSTASTTTDSTTKVAERVTVALIPKVAAELQRLQDRTSLSKTDLANRAITLYEFMDAQMREGRDLLIRDKETGETQGVSTWGCHGSGGSGWAN